MKVEPFDEFKDVLPKIFSVTCGHCWAKLTTEENDLGQKCTKDMLPNKPDGPVIYGPKFDHQRGYRIRCPDCKKIVFIPFHWESENEIEHQERIADLARKIGNDINRHKPS